MFGLGMRPDLPGAGDPPCVIASSKKAVAELNWKPVYTDVKDIIRTAWEEQGRKGSVDNYIQYLFFLLERTKRKNQREVLSRDI